MANSKHTESLETLLAFVSQEIDLSELQEKMKEFKEAQAAAEEGGDQVFDPDEYQ